MKKIVTLLLLSLIVPNLLAQGGWTWTQKADMPEATSNNAVTGITIGDTSYVFSFAGIDTSRTDSGIHTKSYRYNVTTNVWDTIPDLPDSLGGVVAASASTVGDKIYVIGGYQVYPNATEFSSYEVHIFDPVTLTYSKGKNLPFAIDDHVYFVYKDSLIYIITGWSSDFDPDRNINAVQIYDPSLDQWTLGTSTPNNNSYMCFGGSGALVGDTIYYAGGAQNGTFSLRNNIRKGVINPADPTQITWSLDTTNPNDRLYRSAAVTLENSVYWIGGAATPYNYDGLSYSGSMPVPPTDRILQWNPAKRKFYEHSPAPFKVMDLRGIAQISPTQFVIAGGMEENITVSKKTYLLTYDTSYIDPSDTMTGIHKSGFDESILVYPNPAYHKVMIRKRKKDLMVITDMNGRKIVESTNNEVEVSKFQPGVYSITVYRKDRVVYRSPLVKQ